MVSEYLVQILLQSYVFFADYGRVMVLFSKVFGITRQWNRRFENQSQTFWEITEKANIAALKGGEL